MVFVDELKIWGNWRYGRSCHLLPEDHSAASLAELHAFAASIGMKRAWFQDQRWPHYDLTATRRELALVAGARKINTKVYMIGLKPRKRPPIDFRVSTAPMSLYDDLMQSQPAPTKKSLK